MNNQQTLSRLGDVFRNWQKKRWRAQLIGLNIQVDKLERVRDESRPVRTLPSEADRHLVVYKGLAGLYRRRRSLAKKLGMNESLAACIRK